MVLQFTDDEFIGRSNEWDRNRVNVNNSSRTAFRICLKKRLNSHRESNLLRRRYVGRHCLRGLDVEVGLVDAVQGERRIWRRLAHEAGAGHAGCRVCGLAARQPYGRLVLQCACCECHR